MNEEPMQQQEKAGGPRVSVGRGRSRQDYQTPREFLDQVEGRFGKLTFDLAATQGNNVCPAYCGEESNSLSSDHSWHKYGGLLWLNPPYNDIKPWAQKCALEADQGARILMLVPASVGAMWFALFVHGRAMVLFLHPRLSFDGRNAYPKDLMLCCYGFGTVYQPWNWKP